MITTVEIARATKTAATATLSAGCAVYLAERFIEAPSVTRALAANPNTPKEALRVLGLNSTDGDTLVLVAAHENTHWFTTDYLEAHCTVERSRVLAAIEAAWIRKIRYINI